MDHVVSSPSVPGLVHLALCTPGLSVLSHIVAFPRFLRRNGISLYAYSHCDSCGNTQGDVDNLFEIIISIPLGMYPRGEAQDHWVVLFFIFQEISIQFSIVAALIYISTNCMGRFPFLNTLVNT